MRSGQTVTTLKGSHYERLEMNFTTKKIAKIGMFTALPIVLKIPILQIPNVEFFTFVVFTSGFLLGIIEGGIVGMLSMSIYTVFNPYGLAPIPIAVSQVVSMFIIGISGGILFSLKFLRGASLISFISMGLTGLFLTLLYDFLTNSGVAIVMGSFLPVMLAAIPFALTHLISNIIIFVLLTPVLFRLVKFERRGDFA